VGSSPTCSINKHLMAPQKKKHDNNQLQGLYEFHKTKECPLCGELKAKVKESRKIFEGTRRRYSCFGCDHKYTTYEINSEAYEELRTLRIKFGQLENIFNSVHQPVQQPVQLEPISAVPEGIPCSDCAHLTPYGCSFDIPEAQTEEAQGCNLFQSIFSDNMLT
jgi:hypothetical protein